LIDPLAEFGFALVGFGSGSLGFASVEFDLARKKRPPMAASDARTVLKVLKFITISP
jgi:hypothetical protein